ncbi:MAG: hypothetical protein WBV81_09785 [Ignavibacteriaceae bacterium]
MENLSKKIFQKRFVFSLIMISTYIFPINAQIYEVNYKPLTSKIFQGAEPVKICILELIGAKQKLYEGLIQDNIIKNKFLVYPTDVLIENKASLGNDLDPENIDFLKSLNEILGVEYLLHWTSLSDSGDSFNFTIYSTKNYQKLFDNKFYSSVNSNPVLDVKKLLTDNVEPVYSLSSGELQVNSKPVNAGFKLFKGSDLIKEWQGNEKQKIQAGEYSLVSNADGYKKDIKNIKINGGKTTLVDVKLEPDLSLLPVVSSTDNFISNIRTQLQGNQIKIIYNLTSGNDDSYDIHLSLVNKKSGIIQSLKKINGDLTDVKSGTNRSILWPYKDELVDFSDLKNYEIKMSVGKQGGISWYVYAGGGALLLGGAAALLLKGSSTTTPAQTTGTKIGAPPPRPTGN